MLGVLLRDGTLPCSAVKWSVLGNDASKSRGVKTRPTLISVMSYSVSPRLACLTPPSSLFAALRDSHRPVYPFDY